MWRAWKGREILTEFWFGNAKKREHKEELCLDRRIILKSTLKKWDGRTWTGLTCLRTGPIGGSL
jgi:hypothetical protein